MATIRYAVRRAKTRTEKQQGKRWVAQAEFPGGRKIKLARTRNKAPAVQVIRQEVRNVVQKAANAGAIDVPASSQNSGGVQGYKAQQLRELRGAEYNIE